MHDYLTQDTRHKVIQMILRHPQHLATLEELVYMTGADSEDVQRQLRSLKDVGIVTEHRHMRNEDGDGDVPTTFYGFTELDIEVLDRHEYLSGSPAMRALYDKTEKSDVVQRHGAAPRPLISSVVENTLNMEDTHD
ncbi:ArsR family transcriptional regulator [Halobium palmae]|uniref:ArsR family transcriptional regulator n=1 Tax=Halobium palmae TaxID=1776492 RepID=A0ABD5RU06_9EURY